MNTKAVVLAAGKGTRMMSETNNLPKVLRQACGKPLLHYVLKAIDFIPPENTVLVGGYMDLEVASGHAELVVGKGDKAELVDRVAGV